MASSNSTAIATVEPGGYLALNRPAGEIQSTLTDNLGGQSIDEFDLTRLKVPSGGGTAWEMETLTGTEHHTEISGIIVHHKRTRGFWPVSLDESDSSSPPSCSSPNAFIGYGKQWATKADPDPDGEPRRLKCEECPNAQFGSGKGNGQACQEKAQIFLLRDESFLPIVMTLPAMSLSPIKKYLVALGSGGKHFSSIVTSFTLTKIGSGGTAYSIVEPQLAAYLSPDEAEKAKAYAELLAPIFDRVTAEPAAAAASAPSAGKEG